MRIYQTGTLLKDNLENAIVQSSAQALKKAGFPDDSIERFTDNAVSLLDDYTKRFGEGTKISYSIRRRLVKIELRLWIPGEKYDPFTNGDGAVERTENRVLRLNLNTETTSVSHSYFASRNMISVDIPLTEKRRKLVRDPMIWAVILGAAVGFVCQLLPENVSNVIVNDLFSPVMSIILDLLAGIMGPDHFNAGAVYRFPGNHQFLGYHAGLARYAHELCRYVRGLQNADCEIRGRMHDGVLCA